MHIESRVQDQVIKMTFECPLSMRIGKHGNEGSTREIIESTRTEERSWKDGSAIKNASALTENLGFGSTLGKAQVSVTLAPENPRGFPWAPVCTWST